MKRNILFIVVYTLLNFACHSGDDSADVIPEDEFVKILTEVHIADAVLTEKGLYDRKLKDSTESYYNYIFVKYNISRAEFDKSLLYYGKNPDVLEKMYDQVIANLRNKYEFYSQEKSIFNLPAIVIRQLNDSKKDMRSELWTKKTFWSLPEDGKLNIIKAERKIPPIPATYILSADYLVYPDDKTQGLTMLIYLFYRDGSHNTFKDTAFVKDGKWHRHELKAKANSKKIPEKIICKLADHRRGTKSKHLEIKNVSLIRMLNTGNKKIPIQSRK